MISILNLILGDNMKPSLFLNQFSVSKILSNNNETHGVHSFSLSLWLTIFVFPGRYYCRKGSSSWKTTFTIITPSLMSSFLMSLLYCGWHTALQSSTPADFHLSLLSPRWGKNKGNQVKPWVQISSIFHELLQTNAQMIFHSKMSKSTPLQLLPFSSCIHGCQNQNLQFRSCTQLHLVLSFCLQTVSKIGINCMIYSPICIFLSTSQCSHQEIFIAAGVQKKARIIAWFALISVAIFCTLFIKC